MKPLFEWVIRLYPAAWRKRYAAEMSALLEDSGHRPRDLANLLGAALRAHLLKRPVPIASGLLGLFVGFALMCFWPQTYSASIEAPLLTPPDQFARQVRTAFDEAILSQLSIFLVSDGRVVIRSRHRDPVTAFNQAREVLHRLGLNAGSSPQISPLYKLWLFVPVGLTGGCLLGLLLQRLLRLRYKNA